VRLWLTIGLLLCCSVVCRLLEHGAKDSSELQMLVAPMSDDELLQVGIL
jgi:hypothetical protein